MLKKKLSALLTYHNPEHTLDVTAQCLRIAAAEGITDKKTIEELHIASLYHDTGFIQVYTGHEEVSCALARQELPGFGVSNDSIENICSIIMATKVPQTPLNHIQQIICDADLDYLGRSDFFSTAEKLRQELTAYKMINSEKEWQELQVSFLKAHHYFTKTSRKERQPVQLQHLQEITENIREKKGNDFYPQSST